MFDGGLDDGYRLVGEAGIPGGHRVRVVGRGGTAAGGHGGVAQAGGGGRVAGAGWGVRVVQEYR